jgi:hypothetical protein
MKMKNKFKLLSRVHKLNLGYMYIYLMCFNIPVTYTFGILSYTKLIFKQTKNPKMKLKIECNILMMKYMIIWEIIII